MEAQGEEGGGGHTKHAVHTSLWPLPIHGVVCERGTGNHFSLGFLKSLCSFAGCFVVCLGCGDGSEGQAWS